MCFQIIDISSTSSEFLSGDTRYPGDINQALIELGSTICRVRQPDCGLCPLRAWCRAYATSHPESGLKKTAVYAVYNPEPENKWTSLPDIEDACTVCDPLPENCDVTSYPMKVERKRARDELDVVNVIEWRYACKTDDRWFLLVRRPGKGECQR